MAYAGTSVGRRPRRGRRRGDRSGDRGRAASPAGSAAASGIARRSSASSTGWSGSCSSSRSRSSHRHDARLRARPGRRCEHPGRRLGGHRRHPRGAADPPGRDPRAGRVPAAAARGPRPPAQRRGDARRDRPDHHRQDGHADPQPARRGLGRRPRRAGRRRRTGWPRLLRGAARRGRCLGQRRRDRRRLVHGVAAHAPSRQPAGTRCSTPADLVDSEPVADDRPLVTDAQSQARTTARSRSSPSGRRRRS